MTIKQSQKSNTAVVTTPTSKQPITEIAQVTEDASAWPTVDSVKQKNGWGYADGSTLTNVDGKYDDFNTANGSLVLPNGPFRTKEIDLTFSSTPTGWSLNYAKGVAYSDVSGQWRLKFNISADASTSTNISATVSGVTFFGSAVEDQAITVIRNLAGGPSRAFADATTGGLVAVHDSASDTSFKLSGDVALASAPTWAAANLESYPVIALQDNSGANVLGIPKDKVGTIKLVVSESASVTDIATNGNASNSGFKFTGLSIGSWYTLDLTAFLQIDANGASTNYVSLKAKHDGNTIATRGIRADDAVDTTNTNATTNVTFKATASTITFDVDIPNTGSVRGNGTFDQTSAQLFTRSDLESEDVGNDFS